MMEGEKLPESINKALYALREGRAYVTERRDPDDTSFPFEPTHSAAGK